MILRMPLDIKQSLTFKNVILLKNLLKLELDGKIYYDFVNNCYYVFPSNFFLFQKLIKLLMEKLLFWY